MKSQDKHDFPPPPVLRKNPPPQIMRLPLDSVDIPFFPPLKIL